MQTCQGALQLVAQAPTVRVFLPGEMRGLCVIIPMDAPWRTQSVRGMTRFLWVGVEIPAPSTRPLVTFHSMNYRDSTTSLHRLIPAIYQTVMFLRMTLS